MTDLCMVDRFHAVSYTLDLGLARSLATPIVYKYIEEYVPIGNQSYSIFFSNISLGPAPTIFTFIILVP